MEHLEEDGRVVATPARRRPIGITVLAILVAIGGLGAWASAGIALYETYYYPILAITGFVLFVSAIVYILAAIGLLSLTIRSWWAALIASAAILAASIGQMVFLGRSSFLVTPTFDDFLNGLLLGLPFGLLLLALIILVSLVVLRGSFGVGVKAAP